MVTTICGCECAHLPCVTIVKPLVSMATPVRSTSSPMYQFMKLLLPAEWLPMISTLHQRKVTSRVVACTLIIAMLHVSWLTRDSAINSNGPLAWIQPPVTSLSTLCIVNNTLCKLYCLEGLPTNVAKSIRWGWHVSYVDSSNKNIKLTAQWYTSTIVYQCNMHAIKKI